ncbi:hypothetical protein RN001_015240 [Aquatica leii]|uniref:ABC-type xenobiotic transporter n=1 Tax=Aquatica leii TaxID=1421715 RepID=A0AAN7S6K2_9COLE|nr:hypothetical protein RN001_015240 [Aquatica leii]
MNGIVIDAMAMYSSTTKQETDNITLTNAKNVFKEHITSYVVSNVVLGVVSFFGMYLATVLFNCTALNQTFKIRDLFFTKILNQDIGWYDLNQTGDFASRVADDLRKVQEGIGEKVPMVIGYIAVFATSVLQALIIRWDLALVCMASLPINLIAMFLISRVTSKFTTQEISAYGAAGAVAEEVLSAIKTVVAFGGEKKEKIRYNKLLKHACNINIKRSFYNGICVGTMWLSMYACYALGFWYSAKKILADREDYNVSVMVTVFLSISSGAWFFTAALPYLEIFAMAKGAAVKIFDVIATEPVINASKNNGMTYETVKGKVTLKNVYFSYPSRPGIQVLGNFNLTINPGETVALVGSSGCGKSTCVQLIQRFYDPEIGFVLIDDHNLAKLDLTWIRSHIGVVGQEPVLFDTTIAENIRLGCENATQEDIETAAKKSNAHNFIETFPEKYETLVGQGGMQLSGGQKQRIAIARALVRKPSILLLDEATSALDASSEAIVQAAFEVTKLKCTTIIIAHRLSTIKQADRILVLSEGQIQEEGTHEELLQNKSVYYDMVMAQLSQEDVNHKSSVSTNLEVLELPKEKIDEPKENSLKIDFSKVTAQNKQLNITSIWTIMKYNLPEWWAITLGCVSSLANGAGTPVYAIIFGKMINVLVSNDHVYIENQTAFYTYMFLAIAVILGFASLFQTYTFGLAGEKLTRRLRSKMFQSYLSQDMSYFDHTENSVGTLCSNLSKEAASVQGATGQRIGTILTSLSTVVFAVGISFLYEWRVTLVSLCTAPFLIAGYYWKAKLNTQDDAKNYKTLQHSTKIAVEAINEIRTVASLGCEKRFYQLYLREISLYQQKFIRNSHYHGIIYGLSRGLLFFAYAINLYYGSLLIINNDTEFYYVLIVNQSITLSCACLGQALTFTPNFHKGVTAANRIIQILNQMPLVRHGSGDLEQAKKYTNLEYKNVNFSYPLRPSSLVLKDFSMKVFQGKVVALVGPSGCGKSTVVQLLQRFYDPTSGSISLGDTPIHEMRSSALRSQLGVVSQEPVLFSFSIADNISYGDNARVVPETEIIEAARKANIHDFIVSLPLGYNTILGEKGSQLSGGQKQRIAIARALVRNPKILLLDEATSALDSESEKIVQEALDNAKQGRTCIIISHRLNTIQDADLICVINQGQIVEMGNHFELLNFKGLYHSFGHYAFKALRRASSQPKVCENLKCNYYKPIIISYLRNNNFKRQKPTCDTSTKHEVTKKLQSVSYLELYRHSTSLDKLFMLIAIMCSFISAVCVTVLCSANGGVTDAMVIYSTTTEHEIDNITQTNAKNLFKEKMTSYVVTNVVLCVFSFAGMYLATVLFNYTAFNQTFKIRELFFSRILNQDISWYDLNQTGDFASRIADDVKKVQEGIGEKVPIVMSYILVFITCVLQALFARWELALVCMASVPINLIAMGLMSWVTSKFTTQEITAYGAACAIAEEVLSAIRTVVAFGGEKKEKIRYNALLKHACNINIKRSFYNGICVGTMWLSMYACYASGFLYGVKNMLAYREDYNVNVMVTVFLSINSGTFFLTAALPYLEIFAMANGAAVKIFDVIATEPIINTSKNNGMTYEAVKGKITFQNVYFSYPSRAGIKVLKNFNLTINPGETVALVGSSGCGKSTCVQLIQRFYDPEFGTVLIDDYNLAELDLTWIRSHIGVVGQEPALFDMTIAENIRLGCENATQEDIEAAAKKSNAHNFIGTFPEKYETLVGQRGMQLSGGQKQRIAIARALVRKPSILLLDEATSALDASSEAVVQAAFAVAETKCTTIIIAHKLLTIKKADRIVVLSEGHIQEEGTHEKLIQNKSAYYDMVMAQLSQENVNKELSVSTNLEVLELPREKIDKLDENTLTIDFAKTSPQNNQLKISSIWSIMKYNLPEWWAIALGFVCSLANGAAFPVYAVIFGKMMNVLASDDSIYIQNQTAFYSFTLLVMAVILGVASLFQTYTFGLAGEKLTRRLRSKMFQSYLSQDMSYFDHTENSVGILCANLSKEAASVQRATGQRIGTILMSLSTVVLALSISFFYEWRVTFVSFCSAPIIIAGCYFKIKLNTQDDSKNNKTLQHSTKIAVEAINEIRTVASLGCEKRFYELYLQEISLYQQTFIRNSHYHGFIYGLSRASKFLANAINLYYGSLLIINNDTEFYRVLIVNQSITFSCACLGQLLTFTPTFNIGVRAAKRIIQIINQMPFVRHGSRDAEQTKKYTNVKYENVQFSYPLRPSSLVLKDLSMKVFQGKVVALVGPSGCGKSTVVQLLQRFYDPTSGSISLDGTPIHEMHLSELRSQLGVVSQEPVLFSTSIADNISYGDNARIVPPTEIFEAAIKANIHDFIVSLPLGYDTIIGEKGSQLSGGQKQRIAIARALVRNPNILLLDEATSALDSESEKIVQEALDNAKQGRTCIIISHRLNTIQDVDLICVINQGQIVEMGTISALVSAVCFTLLSYTVAEGTSAMLKYITTTNRGIDNSTTNAEDTFRYEIEYFVVINCSLGVCSIISLYAAIVLFSHAALNQTFKIRKLFLKKILNQDITWYDLNQTGDFASRMADDLKKVQEGIGEKVPLVISYFGGFLASIIQALIVGWELALVCMASLPISLIAMGLISWITSKFTQQEGDAYGAAGAVAEEVFSAIRTVVAFGGEKKAQERYNKLLKLACDNNVKRSFYNGICNGATWCSTYACYALGFWYGVEMILTNGEKYNVTVMVTVFFSVVTATWYLTSALPYLETFAIAQGAAVKIFEVIASEPVINASKNVGKTYTQVKGKITFNNVYFSYPSRQSLKVLQGFNLTVNPGETVALVGNSGCGKSTCVQLIQRYYDPELGNVLFDDYNLSGLDVSWVRSHIGVVGQEPVLFDATIAENIRFGCEGATQEDIEEAARKANAHNFIEAFSQKYETLVGERGAQLSGGQKQRIAIARALVRKPSILLLDEATSALDSNSEGIVQAALDAASTECTTIIVAHRLSTIKRADRIVVMSEGKVQEEGTHENLMQKRGAYFALVMAQVTQSNDEEKISAQNPLEAQELTKQIHIDEEQKQESVLAEVSVLYKYLYIVLVSDDADYIRRETAIYGDMFLVIAVVLAIAALFQTYLFGLSGEKLTMRLRKKMFQSYLSQDMSYFDDKTNSVGTLSARLSYEAASVQGATGQRIGTILTSFATVLIGLCISFYYEWRITLVSLLFAPLMVTVCYWELILCDQDDEAQYKSLQQSTKIAVEAINGIRTVASLGCEKKIYDLYMQEMAMYQQEIKRKAHFHGIIYGLSQAMTFFTYAGIFYYASTLIINKHIEYHRVIIVSEAIISCSWSLSSSLAFAPNFQKGVTAINRITQILNNVPLVRNRPNCVNQEWKRPIVEYKNILFSYPSRPRTLVLDNFDIKVLQGKMVALVGPSGCGKSTIMQLLLRFYDPTSGTISVDDVAIQDMHLSALRSQLGVVSQEPVLFSLTIADNISYGDNTRAVSNSEIVEAARKANIHNFIASLPLGYDTILGEKGTQLSGGQKQRIAIARALIRNPKILLLDEATSALDAESEKIVQEALDNASKSRTCITIAHRLNTIQKADIICFIKQGRIVEMGSHSELLNLKGFYYDFCQYQS